MTTPVDREVPRRDEVTIKLLVAMVAGVVDPQAVVESQRVATLTALQDYTRLRADTEPDAEGVAWLLQLERLAMQARRSCAGWTGSRSGWRCIRFDRWVRRR